MPSTRNITSDMDALAAQIKTWGAELGFQQIDFAHPNLTDAEPFLLQWLEQRFHGEMDYMERHGTRRSRPTELVPGTLTIISARMDYLPQESTDPTELLDHSSKAYVSRYALGRDYHKVIRRRLQTLADRISDAAGEFGYRAFVDSAPVLEKALAQNAGLGWIGKHTNLINKNAGSWFFLGELFTSLPLPVTAEPSTNHCGSCTACIDVCPTRAIVGPYKLDARRCISYLTIEMRGSIPVEFREAIGNRIYGCDDCQLFCPWNKFAQHSGEADFSPRHQLNDIELAELFRWTESQWLERMSGSAIRRIGYEAWSRNVAVALGNAASSHEVIEALRSRLDDPSALVQEHVQWALARHTQASN